MNMSKKEYENMLSTVRMVLNPRTYMIRMSHQNRLFSDPHGPVTILAYVKMYKIHAGTIAKTTNQRPKTAPSTDGLINSMPTAHMSCTHKITAANLMSSRKDSLSRFNLNTMEHKVSGAYDIESSETRPDFDSGSSIIKQIILVFILCMVKTTSNMRRVSSE